MADLNRKMAEGHTVSDLDTVIDEVYGAHGDYDTLGDRLDDIDTIIDTAKLGIHYKGEVNYYSNLPTTGVSIGDAYTVKYAGSSGTTPDGTEYVWGTVSGTNQWINFSKDSYTKAEVDALLALKVDTAGTGLSKSGTTLNHSNSTTAKTTQGFAQIAYDAQGHITGSTAATTAQANAINSGIDSTKVEQIETNKNNILLSKSEFRNLIPSIIKSQNITTGGADITLSVDDDLTITLNGTVGTQTIYISIALTNTLYLPTGIYWFSGISENATDGYDLYISYQSTFFVTLNAQNKSAFTTIQNAGNYGIALQLRANETYNNQVIKPMLITKEMYDAGFTDYQPYAMSNSEITAAIRAIQSQIANQ